MKKYLAFASASIIIAAALFFSCSKETATFYANIDDFLETDSTLQPEFSSTGLRYILNTVCPQGERVHPEFSDRVEIWCRGYLADGVTDIESNSEDLSLEVNLAICRDTTEVINIIFDSTYNIETIILRDTTYNMEDSTQIVTDTTIYDSILVISDRFDTTFLYYAEDIEYQNFSSTKVVVLEDLIFGLKEGITLLSPGDRGQFFIPTELAYGLEGSDKVPPNADVIYEVQLIRILE